MVVAVLFNAGLQLPLIPFNDVVGKAANIPPEQIAGMGLKVGVAEAPIVGTVKLILALHPLSSFIVIVYGPAANARKILPGWKIVPFLL